MKRYTLNTDKQFEELAQLMLTLNRRHGWVVTIERDMLEKTGQQNRYYHAVIDEIAKATGNSPRQVKTFVYEAFGPRTEVRVGEISRDVVLPREEWNIEQTSDFIERLRAFAAEELGVIV